MDDNWTSGYNNIGVPLSSGYADVPPTAGGALVNDGGANGR